LHDVDGDGKPDTTPRTVGNGPNNGFLETKRDGGFTISVKFADGDVISKSAKISWNEGNIIFDMPNYTPNESAKLQVADVDMNLNPETLDVIKVHVFSDSDKAGILVNAIETQEESGLFETTVSFTQDRASSGNRLFTMSGDVIYAKYEDRTLPAPYGIHDSLDIITESIIKIDSKSSQKTILDDVTMNESSVKIESDNKEKKIKSPLKQFKAGITLEDLKCKTGLEHTIKINDFKKFYCTSPDTKQTLIERGWAFDESKACRNPMDCFDSGMSLDKTVYPNKRPLPNGTFDNNLENVIPWLMMQELEKQGIKNWKNDPTTSSHTDEGWLNPSKMCSSLFLDDETKLYISTSFYSEPELTVSEIIIDDSKPTNCQKWFWVPYGVDSKTGNLLYAYDEK